MEELDKEFIIKHFKNLIKEIEKPHVVVTVFEGEEIYRHKDDYSTPLSNAIKPSGFIDVNIKYTLFDKKLKGDNYGARSYTIIV